MTANERDFKSKTLIRQTTACGPRPSMCSLLTAQ